MLYHSVRKQVTELRSGFNEVLPIRDLNCFTENELEILFRGSPEEWTMEMLVEHTKCDHGYSHSSTAVQNLLHIVSEFDPEQQRQFLRFITGCPRLPYGGLKSLNPKLTIVKKVPDNEMSSPDEYLPSVSTCFYYLKVPDYSSKEIMRERLMYAVAEGQGNFHLS
eukprot:GFYU01002682.1.p1 GENE.GFYU01002682.1~~GFYU01002682.1.p1  ORF type:complete len:165 (-),score=50.36 GFYU01002682.1:307-801(-)